VLYNKEMQIIKIAFSLPFMTFERKQKDKKKKKRTRIKRAYDRIHLISKIKPGTILYASF